MKTWFPLLCEIEDVPNVILLADFVNQNQEEQNDMRCFGPPTNRCLQCGHQLTRHNEPSDVVVFGLKAPYAGKKIILRRKDCQLNYSYSSYGNKENGYTFYTKSRAAVEATDSTLVDRELFELYCSLA